MSNILVVEDDLFLLESVVDCLEDEGHLAQGAASVDDALSRANQYDFDLVITDVRMAGHDGIDGLAMLKEKQPNIRCLVMTGYADRTAQARAIKVEVDDYIHKPFDLDELLDICDSLLRGPNILQRYGERVASLGSKLLSAASTYLNNRGLREAEKSRERVFKGLYVAIRTGLIPANSANGVFSRLDELEPTFEKVSKDPTTAQSGQLLSEYSQLFEFLSALARSKAQTLSEAKIPATQFRVLFSSVQKGLVTADEFGLAPGLYHTQKGELLSVPELLDLRKRLWG